MGHGRPRRVLATIAVAAMAAALPAAVPAAAGAKGGFFGVVATNGKPTNKDLRKMGDANIKSVRWSLGWPGVEHTKGQFNWAGPDRAIGDLASKGIRVLPTLYGSAPWAAKSPTTPPLHSKEARQGWQGFVKKAVQRYGRNGTYWSDPNGYAAQHPGKSPVPVKAWQVWNEPNLGKYFSPRPSPKKYAKLLRISHHAIKAEDSKAKVVFAGMPGYSQIDAWKFLRRVYQVHGAANAFNVAALHPYSPSLHLLKKEVSKFRKAMRQHGDGGKQLWITEIGWGSAKHDRYGFDKGKKGQKRMLKKSFKLFRHKRGSWNIRHVYWYQLRDPDNQISGCSFCSSSGLLTHKYQPKPAYRAFKSFTKG
jgi:hypothetical protein